MLNNSFMLLPTCKVKVKLVVMAGPFGKIMRSLRHIPDDFKKESAKKRPRTQVKKVQKKNTKSSFWILLATAPKACFMIPTYFDILCIHIKTSSKFRIFRTFRIFKNFYFHICSSNTFVNSLNHQNWIHISKFYQQNFSKFNEPFKKIKHLEVLQRKFYPSYRKIIIFAFLD